VVVETGVELLECAEQVVLSDTSYLQHQCFPVHVYLLCDCHWGLWAYDLGWPGGITPLNHPY